ncbi:hypothetical protein K502DRAFT_328715 [Neoconidiobolus thromboides FSU 785]|nr:hypothetical protein K502DRAFT_328715 [Neoconidiobolus thromboides FSU 785]
MKGVIDQAILNLEPKVGDNIVSFDISYTWGKDHILPRELEPLRSIGDDLAQSCLSYLKYVPSNSLRINNEFRLNKLKELVKDEETCPKEVRELYKELYHVPEWVDQDQIKRGQTLYWSYFPLIKLILLNCSLVGGFSAEKIVATLNCTNYLNSPTKAYPRLLETALFVMDCMCFDELKPEGRGWLSAFNVRMMHAQVRQHVLRLPKGFYDKKLNGIPANQEDLYSTILVFSYVVLINLERMGIDLSDQDKEDYMACWRYIAYLLGIKDENGYLASFNKGRCLRESIAFHLYEPNPPPSESASAIATNVLKACSYQPPFFRSYHHNVELTRFFIGDIRSDYLKLPHSQLYKILVPIKVFVATQIVKFFVYINRDWVMSSAKSVGYKTIGKILGKLNPTYQFEIHQETKHKKANRKSSVPDFTSYYWIFILFLFIFTLFLRNSFSNWNNLKLISL